jgi:hypothetical protein
MNADGTTSWSLQFNRAPSAHGPAAGQSPTVLVLELAPTAPASTPGPGVRNTTIAGRRVALRLPKPHEINPSFSATWRTTHAYYSAIANGTDPEAITHVIACLP